MTKHLLIYFTLFFQFIYAQETELPVVEKDSTSQKGKFEILIDISNRYIWRGQSWGGNYAVVQPTIKYHFADNFHVGAWATTNFKNEYFYDDGSYYKGYKELDIFLNYDVTSYLSVQLWDYYWPTVQKVEGIDNNYFNYSKNGVKTVDFSLLFDFSENWLPVNATISTLVAGNDFRYDENGENPKQNFTTYIELGYKFEDIFPKNKIFKKIDLVFNAGMVLNNQAGYYTAGNYNKPSIVNMSVKLTKELELTKKIALPVFVNFIHNGSNVNTETFGKNFLLYGFSFCYSSK